MDIHRFPLYGNLHSSSEIKPFSLASKSISLGSIFKDSAIEYFEFVFSIHLHPSKCVEEPIVAFRATAETWSHNRPLMRTTHSWCRQKGSLWGHENMILSSRWYTDENLRNLMKTICWQNPLNTTHWTSHYTRSNKSNQCGKHCCFLKKARQESETCCIGSVAPWGRKNCYQLVSVVISKYESGFALQSWKRHWSQRSIRSKREGNWL